MNWTAAGCNGAATDRASTPAATARIQQAVGGAVTLSQLASLLAGWLADPGSNQGLLLRPKLNTGGAILTYAFASSEHGAAGYLRLFALGAIIAGAGLVTILVVVLVVNRLQL